jgi:acyl carrier protein
MRTTMGMQMREKVKRIVCDVLGGDPDDLLDETKFKTVYATI